MIQLERESRCSNMICIYFPTETLADEFAIALTDNELVRIEATIYSFTQMQLDSVCSDSVSAWKYLAISFFGGLEVQLFVPKHSLEIQTNCNLREFLNRNALAAL